VFNSEGYHLDLLVIHLFLKKENIFEDCNRQKISVDRCENIKKAARKMENLKAGSGTLVRLLVLRADGCHCFSNFHKAYGSYCP
jgi:hypothetical protein